MINNNKRLLTSGILLVTMFFVSVFASAEDNFSKRKIVFSEIPGLAKFGRCSGIIFKFDLSPKNSRALFLTNGHCVHLPGTPLFLRFGEFLENIDLNQTLVLNRSNEEIATRRIIYSTMTSTDLAIIELQKTYEELRIEPVILDRRKVESPMQIYVPSSYHSTLMTGKVSGIVETLREAIWKWDDALILDLSSDFPKGSSGSPLISLSNNRIIGIGNTGNSGKFDCSIGNPCEINQSGESIAVPGRIYGQQTYQLYQCLNSKNVFDLSTPSCPLPKY